LIENISDQGQSARITSETVQLGGFVYSKATGPGSATGWIRVAEPGSPSVNGIMGLFVKAFHGNVHQVALPAAHVDGASVAYEGSGSFTFLQMIEDASKTGASQLSPQLASLYGGFRMNFHDVEFQLTSKGFLVYMSAPLTVTLSPVLQSRLATGLQGASISGTMTISQKPGHSLHLTAPASFKSESLSNLG
jgi:hypothetical protein